MAICIVVLSEPGKANQINEKIQNAGISLIRCDLIKPQNTNASLSNAKAKETSIETEQAAAKPTTLNQIEIDSVDLLSPNLSKRQRQKKMALLLMPFGFIAGLTFTQMTSLTTFSDLGVGTLGEPVSGGLVGMISGWMGSHVAAASVGSKNDEDITSLRKLSEGGQWLLLLETPFEVELPWNLLKEVNPIEVVRLINQ